MHEIEITEIPPLKSNEKSLLAMHSLLNIFNVLRGEISLLGVNLAHNDMLLEESLGICDELIGSLQDPVAALATARQIDAQATAIFADIEAALATRPAQRTNPDIVESLENLRSVFSILRVRAREQLARAHQPDRWREFLISDLRCDFLEVFSALEKNSHGRFRITYNVALQEPRDYYFDFKIESSAGDRIVMPAVFQDVLRDLVANSRKYTAPGGHITAALYEDATSLRLVVEDTGRGIPQEELETVVHYGRRASNVGHLRTMGGGFGLTKAFFVTKQFGGRFWIASTLDVGTRIRIQVPRPAAGK